MNSIWRTIRNYTLWSYERGSLHYDIMVTLILIFVIGSPWVINFKDKPIEKNPHATGVVIAPDGAGGFVYQISASAVDSSSDAAIRQSLLRVIEPIAGEVSISKYEAVRDRSGRILGYKAWVQR